VGTFAPDPETTLRYAACAAKVSRLLAPYDADLARTFCESAERAWRWAEDNAGGYLSRREDKRQNVRRMRALAAVELLHLTEDEHYHSALRESLRPEDDFSRSRHAWFACALLPDRLVDPELKRLAVEGYRELADTALEFARGNAFSITTDSPQLPMIGYVGYYSVPGMTVGPSLPRAHYLTGEEKYLAGTVAACNFSVGANPMNIALTTGLGHDYPRAPLHIDSRRSAQPPPAGITVFGPSDPALSTDYLDWAHKWKLGPTMIPDSRTWPAAEFYTDIYTWPAMNEYTVHQTFGPTSYHWGYLAARE
jgi:endoglucanase